MVNSWPNRRRPQGYKRHSKLAKGSQNGTRRRCDWSIRVDSSSRSMGSWDIGWVGSDTLWPRLELANDSRDSPWSDRPIEHAGKNPLAITTPVLDGSCSHEPLFCRPSRSSCRSSRSSCNRYRPKFLYLNQYSFI